VAADLGEDCEEQVLRDMIYAADLDQDGKVSKDEFMTVMRKMKLI
jgi:Ca2+-binding EF-hand superfamily protein